MSRLNLTISLSLLANVGLASVWWRFSTAPPSVVATLAPAPVVARVEPVPPADVVTAPAVAAPITAPISSDAPQVGQVADSGGRLEAQYGQVVIQMDTTQGLARTFLKVRTGNL